MEVKNCRTCGRIFNYISGPRLCMSCREKLEEKFTVVKEFVRSNPGVGLQEISDACEVDIPQINQWIREERLTFADDSPIGIPCEKCGVTIKSGRFCDKCKVEMTRSFNDAIRKPEAPRPVAPKKPIDAASKMRFL